MNSNTPAGFFEGRRPEKPPAGVLDAYAIAEALCLLTQEKWTFCLLIWAICLGLLTTWLNVIILAAPGPLSMLRPGYCAPRDSRTLSPGATF